MGDLISPPKSNSGLDLSIIKHIKFESKETPHKSIGTPSNKLPWLGIRQIKLNYKRTFCLTRCSWSRFYWSNSYYNLFPATPRNSSPNSVGRIAYYSWSNPTDPWLWSPKSRNWLPDSHKTQIMPLDKPYNFHQLAPHKRHYRHKLWCVYYS